MADREELELTSIRALPVFSVLDADSFSPERDLEQGIVETSGYKIWLGLAQQVQKRWDRKLSSVWLRTLALLLVIHPVLCLVEEMLWLYMFESHSFSDLWQLLSPSTWDFSLAPSSHITTYFFQIPWLLLVKFKLEISIFPSIILLIAFFTRTLKHRISTCARVCTQAILDPLKLGNEIGSGEVLAQSTCINDAEDVFSRVLQSLHTSLPRQQSAGPETLVSRDVGSIFTYNLLYDPALCGLIHCPLIAVVCFFKFSLVSLFASGDGQSSHTSLSSGSFIFSLIFGVVYTVALLAIAVVWSLFAYYRLPTEEDMWNDFLKDVEFSMHLY